MLNTHVCLWLTGLNYDRNIVQFIGVCVPNDATKPPMLVCELMSGESCPHCFGNHVRPETGHNTPIKSSLLPIECDRRASTITQAALPHRGQTQVCVLCKMLFKVQLN